MYLFQVKGGVVWQVWQATTTLKVALVNTLILMVEGAAAILVETVRANFSLDTLVDNIRSILHPSAGVLAFELLGIDTSAQEDGGLEKSKAKRFVDLVISEINAGNEMVIGMHSEAIRQRLVFGS